jgi:hypothetical protein
MAKLPHFLRAFAVIGVDHKGPLLRNVCSTEAKEAAIIFTFLVSFMGAIPFVDSGATQKVLWKISDEGGTDGLEQDR